MDELDRYSCQLALRGIGRKGQEKLKNAKVLIVGAGGLGCPAGAYLAGAGVGHIGIVDFDSIDRRNLHRQILFTEDDIGKSKSEIASVRLRNINNRVNVQSFQIKLDSENVSNLIRPFDIVIDCTDNFQTKYILNDACVLEKIPLVYGAVQGFEGQVSTWNIKLKSGVYSSNFRDLFPDLKDGSIPDCETGGVIPTITGIIGCIQATEVIKYFTGAGEMLVNKLFLFDAANLRSQIILLPKRTQTKIKVLNKEMEIPTITPEELKKCLEEKKCDLIDVRTKKEHDLQNIGGKNIPLKNFLKSESNRPYKKITIFYCRSGARSSFVVGYILKGNPLAKVLSLKGGIEEYDRFYHA